MSFLKLLLLGGALLYGAAVGAMYVFQRDLQYFPTHRDPPPQTVGLSDVTVDSLPTPDGQELVVWSAPAADGRPTVLFFQGNGGEIADRAARFATYQSAGFGVVFPSLRGYGGSSGSPSETGFLTDARVVYDWLLRQDVAPGAIAVIGESMGTGIAVRLAAEHEVGAMVLGAPYASAVEIAAALYPWLPVRLLMKDQFRSIDVIGDVSAPILFLHGTEDRIIPFSSGQALYRAAVAPKTLRALDGAGHNALYQRDTWDLEVAFLNEVFADR